MRGGTTNLLLLIAPVATTATAYHFVFLVAIPRVEFQKALRCHAWGGWTMYDQAQKSAINSMNDAMSTNSRSMC